MAGKAGTAATLYLHLGSRAGELWCSARLPAFIQPRTPAQEMVPLTFRVDCLTSVTLIRKCPYRHAQRLVSSGILDPS